VLFLRDEIDFVLGHTGGPEQANDFDILFDAEAGDERRGILPEVPGCTLHLPFLIQRTGVNLDLSADGALVVIEGFEVKANPIVLVAALVS